MNRRKLSPMKQQEQEKEGFTMVELLVALVILTVGILALGLLSGQLNQQVNLADVSVERSASLQAAIEELRATPYEDIGEGSTTIDAYDVSWTITESADNFKEIQIVTLGPGLSEGRILPEVPDTFVYRLLARPDVQCRDASVIGDDDFDSDDDDDTDALDLCEQYYPDDDDDADDSSQVCLTHYPPGNPTNSQSICVGASAVTAHLAHGDVIS
jgi:type IV pilus assembly protein PilV